MNLERYDLKVSENAISFRFFSVGRKGIIQKGIVFSYIEDIGVWNLGFDDIDTNTGEIHDLVVSDNGDSEKVLFTVAHAAWVFSKNYPDAIIYAEGSTSSRTRLYQIAINNHLEEITQTFFVRGLLNEKWERFRKNTNYQAFLITRKTIEQ